MKSAVKINWYAKYKWLYYDETSDATSCFYCCKAEQEGKLRNTTKDLLFISKCFVDWKDATEAFKNMKRVCKCNC